LATSSMISQFHGVIISLGFTEKAWIPAQKRRGNVDL
jgi:hypothetical protein